MTVEKSHGEPLAPTEDVSPAEDVAPTEDVKLQQDEELRKDEELQKDEKLPKDEKLQKAQRLAEKRILFTIYEHLHGTDDRILETSDGAGVDSVPNNSMDVLENEQKKLQLAQRIAQRRVQFGFTGPMDATNAEPPTPEEVSLQEPMKDTARSYPDGFTNGPQTPPEKQHDGSNSTLTVLDKLDKDEHEIVKKAQLEASQSVGVLFGRDDANYDTQQSRAGKHDHPPIDESNEATLLRVQRETAEKLSAMLPPSERQPASPPEELHTSGSWVQVDSGNSPLAKPSESLEDLHSSKDPFGTSTTASHSPESESQSEEEQDVTYPGKVPGVRDTAPFDLGDTGAVQPVSPIRARGTGIGPSAAEAPAMIDIETNGEVIDDTVADTNNKAVEDEESARTARAQDQDEATIRKVVMQDIERLHLLRRRVVRYRRQVEKAREEAGKQRKVADQAQQRLLAKISPSNLYAATLVGDNIITLAERAKTAQRNCRTLDEKALRAEKRLVSFEYQLFEQEREVYSKLHWLDCAMPDPENDADKAEDDAYSDISHRSNSSEEPVGHVRDYFETVGQINVLRERLNNFEINHRQALAERFESFERKVIKRHERAYLEETLTHSETSFLNHELDSGEEFLQKYFTDRMTKANELLQTKAQATLLRELCIQLGPEPEEDGRNAVNEALRYNLEGTIGRMYALYHEGLHRGIMPLDLINVPFLHPRDRTAQWLLDMQHETFRTNADEIETATVRPGPQRDFKLYFDLRDVTTDPWDQQISSASDYKPSNFFYAEEGDVAPKGEAQYAFYDRMTQWTCWAGEVCYSAPPASLPDATRLPPSSLGRWDKQKQKESLPEMSKPLVHGSLVKPDRVRATPPQAESDKSGSTKEDEQSVTQRQIQKQKHDVLTLVLQQGTLDHYGKCSEDYIRERLQGHQVLGTALG